MTTKSASLRRAAQTMEREAKRCDREAMKDAECGLVFSAALLSERALRHREMAAMLRCDAMAHEAGLNDTVEAREP